MVVNQPWRGVNLGGWLVLERWITPSQFKGILGSDEYSFCEQLGEAKQERLKQHRDSFITAEDFAWLKQQGINAIRLPVPHWLFEDEAPYVACSEYVDFVFEQAEKHQLDIVLDLHTAPGSQNGNDHSGRQGDIGWHKEPSNIDQTLFVLDKISQRYGTHANLAGIEVLNEPSPKIPHKLLVEFYHRAYQKIRSHSDKTVIFSDAFRPKDWQGEFRGLDNVFLDLHLYRAFGKDQTRLPMHRHLQAVLHHWPKLLAELQKDIPVTIGEWSLGLDNRALRGLDSYERDKAMHAFASSQLKVFQPARGHFFWTYKTEDMAGWSYRDVVQRGWLPALLQ